jgi:hypothetical protein
MFENRHWFYTDRFSGMTRVCLGPLFAGVLWMAWTTVSISRNDSHLDARDNFALSLLKFGCRQLPSELWPIAERWTGDLREIVIETRTYDVVPIE